MVGTLIVAAYAGTTAAGVAASFALTAAAFAVNFAISQIVTRMFMDNPESQQDMGVREQVPPSNVNAIPIVYGEAYMGGTFVDAVLANEQRKMYYVLAISSISPNGQFTFDQTDMYYGDQLITFSGVEPGKVVSLTDQAGNEDTKISGNLFVYLFTSNQAGTITAINSSGSLPSTIMGGADIEVAQRWPASGRQMNGLAFAIVVLNYNRDANTTNLQPITFHVSHTLNGTGVAKPGDVWYDYITNPVYGGAVDAAFVDSTSGTALNAYSDATIPYTPSGGGSATQARYRINGVLDAGQTVLSNLDRSMSSCDSWMTYNAALGKWSVVINKAESTAYAFTDNNIVGDIRVSASDITASINQVEARFPFKENRDQANFVFLALQELNPSLLYPNEPVNKYSITYDLVNDSVQATYLANRLLEQAREDLNVIFNTTYYGIQVDAGNVVSVTNSDYGWDAKLFRVMKVMESSLPDGSLGARIELSEYNAAVYDNQDITQFSPVPNSGLPSVSYFSPLSTPTVTGNPTASVPNFSVTVLIPTTGRITYGNLFYTTTPGTSTSWKLLATAESANSVPVVNGTSYTFLNQVLSAGTYYFAYVVGNDVSQSVLSPASTAFVWSPSGGTTGPTGPTGTAGLRTAILELYKWSATQPTTNFPAGTSVYTWATGQFTMPATPNSWTYTPGSATLGTTLWITRVIYTTSVAEATSTVTWNSTSAYAVGAAGENGTRTGVMEVYQWATEVPTLFPYGQFVYTWATGTFTGSFLRGWSLTPDNPIPGATLYGVTQTIVNQNTTATDTVFWMNQTPYPIGSAGVTGPTGASGSGLNSATVYLYNKNTSTTAPALFSGTFTYTFATAVLSGGTLNGWAQTPPSIAAGEFLFLALATATSATATDTIASTEFSTAQVISGTGTSGANGAQTAIVTIFNKNTSATVAPTSPSGTFTYTFATALLSGGTLNGWAQTAPSILAGEFLWQRQATAYSITATDTIASTEFSGAVVTALAGPTGPSGGGPTGPTGATGTPSTVAGPRNAQIYFFTTQDNQLHQPPRQRHKFHMTLQRKLQALQQLVGVQHLTLVQYLQHRLTMNIGQCLLLSKKQFLTVLILKLLVAFLLGKI
jgi:hypothetical protein